MAANQTIAASIARRLTVEQIEADIESAHEVWSNSATPSRSLEGSNLTVDQKNAESIIETLEESIRILRAQSNGSDPDLSRPSLAVAVDRRQFRIY